MSCVVETRSFFVSQAIARRMVAEEAPRRGNRALVFISSANAFLASPDRAEYTASKAAASMLARCFALRLADDGVPVYDIRPGVIRTDMTAPVAARYAQRIAEGLSPIRRWGEAEDVGNAIAALVTGAIPFSTGDAFLESREALLDAGADAFIDKPIEHRALLQLLRRFTHRNNEELQE